MTEFEHIYKGYFRKVYFFVLSISRNKTVAEEITQETFFKALKNIDKFRGDCKIDVWLCQIAKNTYFSSLNQQKRVPIDETTTKAGENGIDEIIRNKEETFRIHQALHSLDEPYRGVFMLRVFGELSYAQISKIFEKTESWGRVTYHRAKQKMQDLLKEESE